MKRSFVLTAFLTLACGGIGGDLGASDPAQLLLDQRDYPGAEANLQARLEANPKDAFALRLLGDVSFVRGTYFKPRWKENLAKATTQYVRAIQADPSLCRSWSRLAVVVQAQAALDETRVGNEVLDALPWDQGWDHCAGSGLLALAENRRPTDEELDAVYASQGENASVYDVMPQTRPRLVRAHELLDYTDLSWKEGHERPPLTPGGAFAVLKTPAPATGIGGSKSRVFSYAEELTIQSTRGGDIVYLDRRIPGTVSETGVTLAKACVGTTWAIEGPDNYPMGTCTKGGQSKRKGGVYRLEKLVKAGPAHWEHSTFSNARVSWDVIAEGSVVCTGGRVGRLYVDMPTCNVAYERAIPQKRSVPVEAGLPARDRAHAQKMVHAMRMSVIYGPELAEHLSEGEIAVGLPYSLVTYSLPDLTGCQGRALYSKAEIVDGAVQFSCLIDGYEHTFVDLELTDVRAG